jgi:hypothetical protein
VSGTPSAYRERYEYHQRPSGGKEDANMDDAGHAGREDSLPAALHRLGVGFWISQALYVVAKLRVADELGVGARDVADIARDVGADPDALYRVLRTLASVGVFTEIGSRRFSLTRMGAYLRSEVPGSLRAQFLTITELDWEPWRQLLRSVQTGETAFEHAHGMGLFAYLKKHREVGQMFEDAMTAFVTENGVAVVTAYDFGRFGTVVDVGGGHGALLREILTAHRHVRGVLFDEAHVVAGARMRIEAAGLAERCACVAGDFFASVPAGADAYVLASIVHDWDDERARTILMNCRAVMTPAAKLLLVEMVLPPGDAPSYSKLLDLEMFVLTGGCERTEAQYRNLLASAGLRMTRVVPTRTASSLIEAVPA